MNRKKKLRLTLAHFYPVAKYAGAMFVALAYPQMPSTTWLYRGVQGPRLLLLLWLPALLLLGLWLDQSCRHAREKDAQEIRAGVRYGGMNLSTLLALCVPLMFILDALAIAHVYLSYFHTAAPSAPADSGTLLLMACGMVLFIYGRALPAIRCKSIWGIASAAAKASEGDWARIHRAVSLPVTLTGALCLILGAFLSAGTAFAAACILCAAALAAAFLKK